MKTHVLDSEDATSRKVITICDDGCIHIGYEFMNDGEWLSDNDAGATITAREANMLFASERAAGFAAGIKAAANYVQKTHDDHQRHAPGGWTSCCVHYWEIAKLAPGDES